MGQYKTLPKIAIDFFDRVGEAAQILNVTGIAGFKDVDDHDGYMDTRPLGKIHCQYALDIRDATGLVTEGKVSAASMQLCQCVAASNGMEFSIATPVFPEALALLYYGTGQEPNLDNDTHQSAVLALLGKIKDPQSRKER